MTDYRTRTVEEAKTHELVDGYVYRKNDNYVDFAVCMAVRAMWSGCFTVARLAKIAEALSCFPMNEAEVKTTVTRMVRQGVLRKNPTSGFYEVNY